MTEPHPNVRLIQRFDPRDLTAAKDVFSEDFVWHFINPKLPDVQGDFVGLAEVEAFFQKMGEVSGGTFTINPVSVYAAGDELVVTHTKNAMTLDGQAIEVDAVVVWRVVEGRIVEAWDIPGVHTARPIT